MRDSTHLDRLSGSTPCRNADQLETTATFPITLPYTYTTYPADVSKCIAHERGGRGQGSEGSPGRAEPVRRRN